MKNIKSYLYKKINQVTGHKEGLIELIDPNLEIGMNWHENFIVHIASIVRPKVYVELGLYQCELFNRIIPYSERLIGVDISKNAGNFMKKLPKTHFFNLDTQEYSEILKKEPIEIDMLFIDADHSKEAVYNDFKSFYPYVSSHGLILLHDSHPSNEKLCAKNLCGDGYLAIEELSKQVIDYEMVTIPVSPGLTICRKRTNQLKWKE